MPQPLLTLWGLPVTAYGVAITASAMVCALLCIRSFHRAGLGAAMGERFVLFALPLCVLLARVAYVLIRLPFFLERPDGLAFRLWQGGYTVWGAIAGFYIAAFFTGRHGFAAVLDTAAPAGMLMVALGRFSEGLAGQGFGHEAPEAFAFFPFSVVNEWGEARWAIFLLEGAAALAFLAIVTRFRTRPGSRAALALALLCAFQIFFESLREDEVLVWGFVRAGQVVPACILCAVLARGLVLHPAIWRGPRHQAAAGFALLAACIAWLEYALDKTTIHPTLLYAAMLAACAALFALTHRVLLQEVRA